MISQCGKMRYENEPELFVETLVSTKFLSE